jgi:hypothetical protein
MGEGGREVNVVYEDIAYVKARLPNIGFFVREKRWDEAIKEAQNAITGLKDIQEYAAEQRNEAITAYCEANPGYVPF